MRNGGRKQNRRCQAYERLHEGVGRVFRQMFPHLQTHGDIEGAVELDWQAKVVSEKTRRRNLKQVQRDMCPVNAQHIRASERCHNGQPSSQATAHIHNRIRAQSVDDNG